MVRIHDLTSDQPNYLKQIGEGLGSGISAGISDAVADFHKKKQDEIKRAEQVEKFRPQARSLFRQTLKHFKADQAYLEPNQRKAEALIDDLVRKGYSPFDAAEAGYNAMTSGFPDAQGKPTVDIKKPRTRTQEALENVKSGAAKGVRPLVQFGQFPVEAIQMLTQALEKGGKKTRGFLGLDEEKPFLSGPMADLPKPINPLEDSSLLQKYDEITGGRGLPQNAVERIAAGYPIGPLGLVGGTAEEAALGLGVPEELAPLANIASLGLGAKYLEPRMTQALFKLAEKLPFFKTAKSEAKAAGVPAEEMVQKAASNLQGRGVDLTKVAEGDAAALNEFNKELKKTSDFYKQEERFKPRKEMARRQETFEKLRESPLEKYYEPSSKEPKTEAGRASQELRLAPLRERAEALKPQVQQAYKSMLEAESLLKKSEGRLTEEQLARVKSNAELARLNHARMLNELKNTEFEIRNRKQPMTSEQIGQQIEKSFGELREGIKDPNAAKLKKVRSELIKDREAVETAAKLVERGELPGAEVFDEYIKIHQKYNKAYGELINELGEFIKNNQKIPEMVKKVDNARGLRDLIREMQKAGEAKVVNQVDKRKALRALETPSGAFYKRMLKDLKKEIGGFQKQFFEVKKVAHPGEGKVSEVAKKPIAQIGEVQNAAREAFKNPTTENVQKLSDSTGLKRENLLKDIEDVKSEAKKAADKIQAGKATEEDIKKFTKKILNKYYSLKPLRKALVGGTVLGIVQAIGEEFFDYKVSATTAGLVAGTVGSYEGKRRFGVGGAGVAPVAGFVFKQIRDFFENAEAEKLSRLRNSPEFIKRRKDLEERYGKTKANRIVKIALSS